MIYRTLDSTTDRPSYTVVIRNIDASAQHWGSEKSIIGFFDEAENLFYDRDRFDDGIVQLGLSIAGQMPRVRELTFYTDETVTGVTMFVTTQVRKMKQPEHFTREISATYKRHGYQLRIIEMTETEEKERVDAGLPPVPTTWTPHVAYNERFANMRAFAEF